ETGSAARNAKTTDTEFAKAGSHSKVAARARHIADRVEVLSQVAVRFACTPRRFRQQWLYLLPWFIGEIDRVRLRLPLNLCHPDSRLSCPHRKAGFMNRRQRERFSIGNQPKLNPILIMANLRLAEETMFLSNIC